MAVFKVPRISTSSRLNLQLEESEIVYDTDLKSFFGGTGSNLGGLKLSYGKDDQDLQEQIDQLKNIINNIQHTPLVKFRQFHHVLTLNNISDKKIVLNEIVEQDALIKLSVRAYPNVIRGVDFNFDFEENSITWANLTLENFLVEGEIVEIVYSYKQPQ